MKKTSIFGYNFICNLNYEEISDAIIDDLETGKVITNVVTPNAHGIISYRKYPAVNTFCQQSRYILPDGQPIVWLSKLTANKIEKRLTGSDLFPVLFDKLNNSKYSLLFVLNDSKLIGNFEKVSKNSYYHIPPFMKMEDQKEFDKQAEQIYKLVIEKGIEIVFIGISEPKQGALAKLITEKLIQNNYNKSCIFLFLGASYEFYFGLKSRAPVFYQKTGLEWLYRFYKEPKRLFKRYTVTNFQFILYSLKWILSKKP